MERSLLFAVVVLIATGAIIFAAIKLTARIHLTRRSTEAMVGCGCLIGSMGFTSWLVANNKLGAAALTPVVILSSVGAVLALHGWMRSDRNETN